MSGRSVRWKSRSLRASTDRGAVWSTLCLGLSNRSIPHPVVPAMSPPTLPWRLRWEMAAPNSPRDHGEARLTAARPTLRGGMALNPPRHRRCGLSVGFEFAALLLFGSIRCVGAGREAGFRALFDGRSLGGWHTPDPTYWGVEDGAITGRITREHPCTLDHYRVWTDGSWKSNPVRGRLCQTTHRSSSARRRMLARLAVMSAAKWRRRRSGREP